MDSFFLQRFFFFAGTKKNALRHEITNRYLINLKPIYPAFGLFPQNDATNGAQ